MMNENDLEKKMDELLDELFQTTQESRKLTLRERIKQIYVQLNHNDRLREKDRFSFKDHAERAAISCVELTMRHDKRGYVVEWMEGEPTSDGWNGLTDNLTMILEDKEPERRAKSLSDGYKSNSLWWWQNGEIVVRFSNRNH